MTKIALEDIQAKPQTTKDPQLTITMDKAKLPVGQHKFGLTVVDDSKNQSVQAIITVIIVDREKPTAVVEVRDSNGAPVADNAIAFGSAFMLSAEKSKDIGGGSIVQYVWQLLP